VLRDYQRRAIHELRERHRDRPVLCLPTGAGKTTVAAEIIRGAVERGGRCLFLVHRRELVDQAVERLRQFGLRVGRIQAGARERRQHPVQVASIQTLVNRAHWSATLVIVDECAHAVSKSWRTVIERYSSAVLIGLTATPIRLDGKGLGDLFGCIVEPVQPQDLVDAGHLVAPRVYAPPVDLSGVRVRRGDYDVPQLAERMSKLTGAITETYQRHGAAPAVAFGVNVEHSRAIAAALGGEHIDAKTPHRERARVLAALRAGRVGLVSNVGLLTEGWDLPALRTVILARPTKSLALYRQMIGRVMRPPGPVTVLDHAGNVHEHGMPLDPIDWTLSGVKPRTTDAVEPVRACAQCFAVLRPGATECQECGAPVPVNEQATPPVDNPGELVEVAGERPKPTHSDRREWYGTTVSVASARGYKLAWARHKYRDEFNVWPRKMRDIETERYTCTGHEWETVDAGPRRVVRCARCLSYASDRYKCSERQPVGQSPTS